MGAPRDIVRGSFLQHAGGAIFGGGERFFNGSKLDNIVFGALRHFGGKMGFRFFHRFTSGLLIGAILAFLTAMFLDSEVSTQIKSNWMQAATIVAAIFAALIALSGVQRQIEHQSSLAESVRAARLDAARATLPLALLELSDICDNRIGFLINGDSSRKTGTWAASEVTYNTLKECIEFSEGIPRSTLMEIPAIYQIMIARTNGDIHELTLSNRGASSLSRMNAIYRILDWVSFQAIVKSLFDFSRGSSTEVDRPGVATKASDNLLFLNDNGWVLENDNQVKKIFDGARKKKSFSFNSPDWMKKP